MALWDELEELYARNSRGVYRRARQLLGDDESAQDATQEVFLRVMRGGGSVPVQPTPTAWLYRVTTNLCLNRLRDGRRRHALINANNSPPAAIGPGAEARVIVAEILRRVPEDLQDVAVYFFLDEMTYDEIARVLGISRRTVSTRLGAFRDIMERMFSDPTWASAS